MSTVSKLSLTLVYAAILASAACLFGQDSAAAAKERVNELTTVLKSDAGRKEKADACRELARIGTREAVSSLAALLADENLNHMARYGLETIPDASVDEAFRRALGRLHARPLVGVIGSIGVRHDAQAVPALTHLLADSDAEVAQAAARALGNIATPEAAEALKAAIGTIPAKNQLAFAEGLFRCADAFVNKGQATGAFAIYDCLAALPASQQIRAGALRGAIVAHQKESIRLILQGLTSDDFALVEASARAAVELSGTDLTHALAAKLGELPPDTQILALQVLGRRHDPEALPVILAATKTGPKAFRIAAVRALPEIGSAKALPTLLELLDDSTPEVAQTAQESLAALPGPEADEAVIGLFKSSKTSQRLTGIDLIERRRMVGCVPALIQAASDPDARVRPAALKRLGELGRQQDLPALLNLLSNAKDGSELTAAEQAVNAVCTRADDTGACAGKLAALMPDAKPALKQALLRLLGTVGGPEALRSVRAAVDDSDASIHATAIRVLGGWKTPDAAPQLLALAQNATNPSDKMLCLRSYLGWADNSDLPESERLALCQKAVLLVQRDEEKKVLLGALGNITSADSVAMIAPYLDDSGVRDEARAATVAIAEKLLKGQNAAQVAGKLVEPLQKAAQTGGNEDISRRAKTLAQQAQSKAKAQ